MKDNRRESRVAGRAAATPSVGHPCQEPIRRRYRPETAALDDLVEVLHRLLLDAPAGESAGAESTCFSNARK